MLDAGYDGVPRRPSTICICIKRCTSPIPVFAAGNGKLSAVAGVRDAIDPMDIAHASILDIDALRKFIDISTGPEQRDLLGELLRWPAPARRNTLVIASMSARALL